jgi:hypothetical protein
MEYFYSGGGNNRPDFTYRFLVRKITDEMYDWCGNYPLDGPFERWHIIHNYYEGRALQGDATETPLIQFESRKAAYMFSIAFSEYILVDKTYSFAGKYNES